MGQLLVWNMPGQNLLWNDPRGLVWNGELPEPRNTTMPTQIDPNAAISDANKAAAIQKIADLIALLPFLVNLTDVERKKVSKLGEKTMGFHLKCKDYMAQAPEFVPGFVNMTTYANFGTLLSQLAEVDHDFAPYARSFEDTLMQLGHEIYSMDLAFYQNVAQAAKRDVPKAQAIYNDLKTRFPGGGTGGTTPPATPSH